jgi:hypothetical protein
MRMAPPPSEIQKAEESLVGSDTTFTLVPSKQALADAAELKIELSSSDFPLFVADRLAFASPNGGLQVRCLLSLTIASSAAMSHDTSVDDRFLFFSKSATA